SNGIHYFHVIPDSGSNLDEASESNNQYGPVVAAYLYAAGSPNVDIEAITVPDTVVAGTSMTVSWTVRNIGSTVASGTWTDRIRLDTSSGTTLGTFSEERTLQPSETYLETQQVLIPENTAPGNHRLYITTSAPGGNGLSSQYFEVEVAPLLPDLVVAEVSLPTGPVAADSTITVSWIDRNDGEAGITDSWRDRIYLSADDTLDATDPIALALYTMTADLLPGEEAAASHEISVPLEWGPTLYVFVVADYQSNIVEAREDNNIGVSALLPINTFDVNLRPLAIRAPSSVAWGQSFTVEWDVTNDGPTQIESRTWYDRIYLSTDDQLGGDTSLDYGTVSGEVLPSGGTYTRSLTVQTNDDFFLTAPRYLLVQVDGYDSLPESDEQDNVLAIPIELTPTLAPDLVVTTIAAPPTTHAQGQLALSWEVANQGTGPAPAWNDRIFLSSDPIFGSDDTLATLNSGQSLAVAETLQRTAGVDISGLNLTPGQYWIFIQADPDDDIDEINDGNNRRMAGPFQIIDDPRPDLTVTAVNGPSTAASGETVTINWHVDNQGEVDATAPWVDRVYLSSDATWSTGDQPLNFLPRDADLAAAAGYDQSLDITLPETSYQLNRWIIVRTDADGVVP
ncbi:MAG: hypothetical protein KDA21_01365, partial [Phycisphaerales bacterium]|nr:hypothetical protein [Phycisphaerales bacterium]